MKSHLISQVLLKRFTLQGKIKEHDKFSSTSRFKTPKAIAYQEVSTTPEVTHLEKKWGYVETRMATAFQALDEGTLLSSEKHIETVKKFMALHYIRSQTLYSWLEKHENKYFQNAIDASIKANPDLSSEILREVDKHHQRWIKMLKLQIPSVVKSTLPKTEDYILQSDLEIGMASQGTDFILGDIPIVNISSDGRIGILSGVDITQSTGFVLPLGPRHVVALIKNSKLRNYKSLNNKQVKNCNKKSIILSRQYYYSCPKSYEPIY